MVCSYKSSIDESRSLTSHVAEISAVWTAVKATAFATMKRQSAALPSPPAAAEKAASTSLLEPDVTPEVVPYAPAPAKAKKSRKEKAAKSKAAASEVPETVNTERIEHALSDSPATTSVTAVETQQTKHKAKSGAKTDTRATEGHVASDDVHMEEQATKSPEASEPAIHASPQASPRPAPRALQDVQMSSPPRPPAGSDVDEVVIEGHGEGSSDESSSSDSNSDAEDEAEDKDADHGVVPDLSLKDVEALLRGPIPKKSILEALPSDSEEEDEESDEEEPDDGEEEEIKLDKKYRRLSKRFQRETSSSDEEPEPEPEAEPELVPEPEQEPDATQEEEEQEVVAATFMDVDPQQTLEDEVRLSSFNTSLTSELIRLLKADSKAPPTVLSAGQVSAPNDEDVQMSAPGDEEPLGAMRPSSPSPDGGHNPERPVSPTVSMMEEDHRRDASQDNSLQSLAQIEEQLSRTSLRSRTSNLDRADSMNRNETEAPGKTSSAELEDDPIEPADDLVVQESPNPDVIDPIEPEPELSTLPDGQARQQSTPPPLPTSRPGTVQRMKNRDGKLGTPSPVKASELPLAALSFAELDFYEPPTPSAPQAQTQLKGRTTQRKSSPSASSMAPPSGAAPAVTPTPAPAPTVASAADPPAPKRRGRPPLPPEEKERRAAERKAKKDAEKAEKARVRLERAAILASKRVSARSGRAAKAKTAPVVESEDEEEAVQATQGEKAPPTATPRPGWTTLAQTPQTQEGSFAEGESMMVDELRSSSPAHSSPRAAEPKRIPPTPSATAMPPPPTQGKGKSQAKVGSQPQAQVQTDSEPLFLPSSSQVPNTPYALAQPQPTPRAAEDTSEDSGSESDDKPAGLQRARPWLREAPFRRLSDIASQAMFTPDSVFRRIAPATPTDGWWSSGKKGAADKVRQNAESDDDDDDEEEDESDEDEDEGKKSHIPQERRAGAGVQKKRASGLASFAK